MEFLKKQTQNHAKIQLNFKTMIIIITMMLITPTNASLINQKTPKNPPKPKPWPNQFHSIIVLNNTKTSELHFINLYYDYINGRNLNLNQYQLGKLLYAVEYNNGTSYYFTLSGEKECKIIRFDVGILIPNWLDGAAYLGQEYVNGFLCNVWEKVDFIWYYEDVLTQRPVQWIFYNGLVAHVMTFEVGAVLEDSKWQAPVYCFNKEEERHQTVAGSLEGRRQLLRESMPLSLAAV